MLTAPPGFTETLRFGSFLSEARLTVYSGGAPTQYVVPVSACDITLDRTSAQRRTGSITAEIVPSVPPPPELPTSMSSPLAPFGSEVFVELAIYNPGQAPSWVPVGLFAIATAEVADSSIDVSVTLQVYDRSWVVSQRKFLSPYNIPAASGNFADEITHLLNQVWGSNPPLQFNITPTSATVPTASYNEGSDPWQAVLDMATSVGYEVFFDPNGVVVGRPIPDPTTQPVVWNFGEDAVSVQGTLNHQIGNTPYTTPASVISTMTRDRIYNHVIVSGTGSQNATGAASGSTAPVRAEAKDTNPSSPTYYAGLMGDVPHFVQTSLATTTAVAQAMADNDLQAALAQAWTLSVSCPINPLFDLDDVVTVTDSRLGLNAKKMVIDSIQFGVRYDALTVLTGRVLP